MEKEQNECFDDTYVCWSCGEKNERDSMVDRCWKCGALN